MANINIERLRQKLNNLNSRGGSASYWKPPTDGKSATVRLFPYPHNPEDPFLEYHFHYFNKQSILCPKRNNAGDHCPICELATKYFREGDKESAKMLFARQRFYATLVDRNDEPLVGKYWGFGTTIYRKFLMWLADDASDYKNFLNIDDGLDLVVTPENTPGKLFQMLNVEAKRRDTPLAQSKGDVDKILKSIKPADELFVIPSVEEINAKLDEYTSQGEPDEFDREIEKRKQETGNLESRNATPSATPDSIEDMFKHNFPEL